MSSYALAMIVLIGSGAYFAWRCMESDDYVTLGVGMLYAMSAYASSQLGP